MNPTKNIFKLAFTILIVLLYGCSVFKPSVDEKDIPEWVVRKPQMPLYYVGVGSAPKQGYSANEYIQNARQSALADLAESISITIESQSMLSVIERDQDISESFTVDIHASTRKELEGYELVDSWQDDKNYWVYYRLCMLKHEEIIERRKNDAINNALSKYQQATGFLGRNAHYNAFQLYADALSDIRMYLGETTETEINGEKRDLGNYLFTQMSELLTNLNIEYPHDEIRVKRGVEIDPEKMTFFIKDENNNPVSNIPFRISFSGSGLLRNHETSDSEGKITCALRRVSSSGSSETLSITVNLQNLSRVTSDPIVRNVIRSLPAPGKSIRVIIERPTIFISSVEKILDDKTNNNELKNAMASSLSRDFEIINYIDKADFIVNIESNTTKKGKHRNEYYVTMNFDVRLNDNQGNNLFRRTIENDYSGRDLSAASRSAYQSTKNTIERSLAGNIARAVN